MLEEYMLRRLGRVIWTQSRDMRIINYPETIVYEIYTNQGFLYIGHDKKTDKIEKLDAKCLETFSLSKFSQNKDEKVLVSDFQ